MRMLKFGQPAGSVYQFAYTVGNIEKGMADFSARLGVGPWFTIDYSASPHARYRGEPTKLRVTIALGFAGHINVELFELLDDSPSPFREIVDRRGHGFHHWAIGSDDFERDVAHYQGLGYEIAFYEQAARGRVVYMDTTRDLPGMLEICEMTERQETRLHAMYQASVEFDGKDPVRVSPL